MHRFRERILYKQIHHLQLLLCYTLTHMSMQLSDRLFRHDMIGMVSLNVFSTSDLVWEWQPNSPLRHVNIACCLSGYWLICFTNINVTEVWCVYLCSQPITWLREDLLFRILFLVSFTKEKKRQNKCYIWIEVNVYCPSTDSVWLAYLINNQWMGAS